MIDRYPEADPRNVLSPGHFRASAAYWHLAGLCTDAGCTDKAVNYRKKTQRYVGTHFV